MPGYMFVHMETHAMARAGKSAANAAKRTAAGKQTKAGPRPVPEILAELLREAGAHPHVPEAAPPVHIDGLTAAQLRERLVVDLDTARVANGGTAIRKDRRILLSLVTSHPYSMEECRADPAKWEAVREWSGDAIAFLRSWAADQGGELVTVYAHLDETYPHMHAYVLADPRMGCRADDLHPGRRAKRDAEKQARDHGAAPKEAVKIGNDAYKAAMRGFQDAYYQAVAIPHGLTRIGPARRRLTRAERNAELAAATATATAVQAAKDAELVTARADAIIADARRRADAMMEKAREQLRQADTVRKAMEEERAGLAALTGKMARWLHRLERLLPNYMATVDRLFREAGRLLGTSMQESLRWVGEQIGTAAEEGRDLVAAATAALARVDAVRLHHTRLTAETRTDEDHPTGPEPPGFGR